MLLLCISSIFSIFDITGMPKFLSKYKVNVIVIVVVVVVNVVSVVVVFVIVVVVVRR